VDDADRAEHGFARSLVARLSEQNQVADLRQIVGRAGRRTATARQMCLQQPRIDVGSGIADALRVQPADQRRSQRIEPEDAD